jgi:hypothetical protein
MTINFNGNEKETEAKVLNLPAVIIERLYRYSEKKWMDSKQ